MLWSSTRQHIICRAAVELFKEKGFEHVSMAEVAARAGVSEAGLYTLFGNTADITLFLYQAINARWQQIVGGITETSLAARFEQAMIAKVELMAPFAGIFTNMMGLLLGNAKIGVNAPRTSHIRAMVLQVMEQLVAGSRDSRLLRRRVSNLPHLLFMMHWGVLFLYVYNGDKEKTIASVRLASGMLGRANNISFLLPLFPFLSDVGNWAGDLLGAPAGAGDPYAAEIIRIILNHRKISDSRPECVTNLCTVCRELHEPKVRSFTDAGKPVHFILPAFPAKSPNTAKVTGKLPDLGEEIALTTLEDLCREIGSVYPPGASVTICSDGRIFSDLVGVTDDDVTAYVSGIRDIIATLGLQHISIVNLEDLMQGASFTALRAQVLAEYATPLEQLEEQIAADADYKNLFNGIHRFITDDRRAMFPATSVSSIKKESKHIAAKVIRHSNAWTRFLSVTYPDAIRLSIHPYPAHHDKIGIRLTKAADNWITPWHGVIVLQDDGYMLMKKTEAEDKGAKPVMKDGRLYYYTLIA